MDVLKLKETGVSLGYEGDDLKKFVVEQQNIARQERLEERETLKAREEKEMLTLREEREERACEREMLRRKAEMEHEREMLILQVQADTNKLEFSNAGNASSVDLNRSCSKSQMRGPMLPRFKESECGIDAYLERFERFACSQDWSRDNYAVYLSALLEGPALEVYHRLSREDANDYDCLKEALLIRYSMTVEDFRKKFLNSRQSSSETATQFLTRLEHFFKQWVSLSKTAETFEGLSELIVGEQFLHACPRELAIFIRERKPKDVHDMADLASLFAQSRVASGVREVKVTPPSGRKHNRAPEQSRPDYGVSRNQGNSGGLTHGVSSAPKYVMRCFLCNVVGHKAQSCPTGRPSFQGRSSPKPMAPKNPAFVNACLLAGDKSEIMNDDSVDQISSNTPVITSYSVDTRIESHPSLPMMKGSLNGNDVTFLIDSGSSAVLVRTDLISPDVLTGDTRPVVFANGITMNLPVVECVIDTPVFSGTVEALSLPSLIFDMILPGVICNKVSEIAESVPDKSGINEPAVIHSQEAEVIAAVETRAQRVEQDKPLSKLKVVDSPFSELSAQSFLQEQSRDKSLEACFLLAQKPNAGEGKKSVYFLKKGLLYRLYVREGEMWSQLVVPQGLRDRVLSLGHESIMSGHLGIQKTSDRIVRCFYWPGIVGDIKRFCQSCDVCQRTVDKGSVRRVPVQITPLVEVPFHKVAIDIIGPLTPPTDRKHRWILTLVDCATRYPEAIPLASTTTEAVAEALLSIFARVGVPVEVLSDNGPQFVSNLMKEVSRLMSIQWINSSPYHPQANGLVERFNGTLKKMLIRLSSERPRDWDRYLEPILFAYREVPQASTHYSPFELLYGRSIRGPMTILREIWANQSGENEAVEAYRYVFDLRNRLEDTCKMVHDNLSAAQSRYKSHFDKRAKARSLNAGEEVLLMLPTDSNKLMMRWKGPYVIQDKVGVNDYRILVGKNARVFHVNMIKRYVKRKTEVVALVAILDPVVDTSLEVEPLLGEVTENVSDVNICGSLTESRSTELRVLLQQYEAMFSDKPGHTSLVKHSIHLTTDKPVRVKPYPIPYAKVSTIEREVDKMLRLGVIEPSESAYSSPLLLVKKADGSFRPCVDFRMLNRVTIFDAEPMSNPEQIFSSLTRDIFFSKVDCSKGYWQIAMNPSDIEKTAFSTPRGLFQFRRMPFGLVNAGASYCRMMRKLLYDIDGADNYVDDIIIHTNTWTEHVLVLDKVFHRLSEAGVTVKPSKCYLGYSTIDFVGHRIGKGEIRTQADKVDKVKNATIPTTVTQVKSFLGLTGYYRKFIYNYATIATPLTDLTKKGRPSRVVWTDETDKAFNQLKASLCSDPILKLPDFDRPFVLRTDASDTGLGAMLLQKYDDVYFPVAFASKRLSTAQMAYAVVERECLAIVWALEHFSVYLYGRDFVIQTDHQPLAFLKTSKLSNPRLLRWALRLQPYQFNIQAISGLLNVGADYLSRIL